MIFSKVIIIFIIIFYTSISFGSVKLEDEIKSLEKKLYELQADIKKKNKVLQELKKFLILTIIKQNLNKGSFLSLNNENNYYQVREKYEFYVLFYQNLERKIRENQRRINELKGEYETKLKKLKEIKHQYAESMVTKEEAPKVSASKMLTKDSIIDPVTGEAIGPGKYRKKLPPGVSIKAPHSGIVKKIKFTTDTFSITLEGPKCSTTLIGVSVLKVNLGEEVKAGQVLGESGFSEEEHNLVFEIECAK